MGLIVPAALGFIALAIPIIIFYMLRLRRQPAPISSLLLWQRVLQDHEANAPWQRVRRNLLLLLQLLLLALLVLALARPFRTVEARVQGNVILLIDASASMQATDVSPSRFEAAKAEALSIIRTLRPGDMVSLITVEATPRPLIIAQVGLEDEALEGVIRDLRPTAAAANWETAIALAAASATSQPNSTVVVLSDGAIPTDLSALPTSVETVTIGQDSANQGIVALATREGRNGPELFIRLANFADQPANLLVEILVDGQLFDARDVDLEPYPAGSTGLTFAGLPATSARIEARLNQADDLGLDNRASTTRRSSEGRILLVGQGNLFLERAFSLIPGFTLTQVTPENYPTQETFDLTIFDRNVPATLPEGNLLFIGPPDSTTLFTVQGTFTNTVQVGQPSSDHPLMRFVDFANLNIAQAQAIEPPAWGTVLLNSQGGPLIVAGQTETRRVALITFDLLHSDLPLQIDFPILISNLTGWFFNQPFVATDQTTAETPSLLDFNESNIRPDQARLRGLDSVDETSDTRLQGQQEFWWVLGALALLVLFWEWQVYWRGTG